jgi:hypothetical protein
MPLSCTGCIIDTQESKFPNGSQKGYCLGGAHSQAGLGQTLATNNGFMDEESLIDSGKGINQDKKHNGTSRNCCSESIVGEGKDEMRGTASDVCCCRYIEGSSG